MNPTPVPLLPGAHVLRMRSPVSLPTADHWLQVLTGSKLNWWHTIVWLVFVVQDTSYITNPLHHILVPRAGQKVVICLFGDQSNQISIYGAACSFGHHQPDFLTVNIRYNISSHLINLTLFEEHWHDVDLSIFSANMNHCIHICPSMRLWKAKTTIKEFYWQLWFSDDKELQDLDVRSTFTNPKVTISVNDVQAFCVVVGNQQEKFKTVHTDEVTASMDYTIITGWQAIMKIIFPFTIDKGLLKLVHLSQWLQITLGSRSLKAGDICCAEAWVVTVLNGDSKQFKAYLDNIADSKAKPQQGFLDWLGRG